MRRGVTLAECMIASAILGLLALVLLSGMTIASRIASDNAQLLAAEAVAWDAAWKRFNEGYDRMETTGWQNLSSNAAPVLGVFDTPAKVRVDVSAVAVADWRADLKVVTADVEWGPGARRRKLSDGGHAVQVWRGSMGRAP